MGQATAYRVGASMNGRRERSNRNESNSTPAEGNATSKLRILLRRFYRDRSGNYLIITALAAPVLIGLAGLGTENGIWLYTHQKEQSAADAAAFSAAQAYSL